MKKHQLQFQGLLLLLSCLVTYPSVAQKAGASASVHHTLWEVQGSSNVVYLLGSIHLLKPTDYPLPAAIGRAFTNSAIAVFETDLGKMNKPATQIKMLLASTLPAGQTLKKQLSPKVYAAFTNHVASAGLPLATFQSLKPSMAAATLEVFELLKLGLNPRYGVDQHFFNLARKEGKKIVPLETVEFQINLVTDFSKQEGNLLMKSTLDEIDQTKKIFGDIVSAWRQGNAVKLAKLLNDAKRETPAIYKRLVTDRNRRWLPKIEGLLHGSKNAIVIVGAGHLVGKKGVVELLEKAGFKVKQL